MKAAQLIEYGKPLEIREIPLPEPGVGEVLIRVGGSGACHSDLHVISGEIPVVNEFPWTLGHENAGWVEALGVGATGVEVGTPVAIYGGWGCGVCRLCLSGNEQICDISRWGGVGRPGGFAEYFVVPAVRHLIPLTGLEPAAAAPLTDAALTPYHAVSLAVPRLVAGTTALVIGVGGLGHFGVQFLRELTAARIVAVDKSEAKRDLALQLGADLALDPSEDVAAAVRRGGEGAACVFDFVGSDGTLALSAASVGRQGIVVLVGIAGGSVPFSFLGMPSESLITSTLWGTRNELSEVLALASDGRLTFHTELHPLEDINEVFHRLASGDVLGRAVFVP